jgi:hypothetical protein
MSKGIEGSLRNVLISGAKVSFDGRTTAEVETTRDTSKNLKARPKKKRDYKQELDQLVLP